MDALEDQAQDSFIPAMISGLTFLGRDFQFLTFKDRFMITVP
jgi:hypothetical protein